MKYILTGAQELLYTYKFPNSIRRKRESGFCETGERKGGDSYHQRLHFFRYAHESGLWMLPCRQQLGKTKICGKEA